jgi:extracellular factor (EF) 3-hydroxypalmitic acid methyl ester biosynthesis protein
MNVQERISSNQLINPKSIRAVAKERRYKLDERYHDFKLSISRLDDKDIHIQCHLHDLSRYGGNFICDLALPWFHPGIGFRARLVNDSMEFSGELEGIIIWEKVRSGRYVYGIQFNAPVEINIHSSIFDAIVSLKQMAAAHRDGEDSPPATETLSFLHNTMCIFDKITPVIDKLDRQINQFRHESTGNIDDQAVHMVYSLVEPLLDQVRDEANSLFQHLPKGQADSNFAFIRNHIRDIYSLCPFLKRSIEQPLGYAGDYALMQSIYRDQNEGENLLGRLLHRWTMNLESARAVRGRQYYFHERIRDRLLSTNRPQTFLSVACGPAQEVVHLIHNTDQEVLNRAAIYLLDQDSEALNAARHAIRVALLHSSKQLNVVYLDMELGRFLARMDSLLEERFDMIYSAGLFDYVRSKTARRISRSFHELLHDGGEIYLGNFSNSSRDMGFLEIINWTLLYRTDEQLLDFFADVEGPCERKVITSIHPQKYAWLRKMEGQHERN